MSSFAIEQRKYIRHPSCFPIEVSVAQPAGETPGGAAVPHALENIGFGGLCFVTPVLLETGRTIGIRIPMERLTYETKGRVVWCRRTDGGYETGIEFTGENDAYRIRMVEQVCHIEQYRREMHEKEGRTLTGTEAAIEWIDKYAKDFPDQI